MDSDTWTKNWTIGRVQIGYRIMRHNYPQGDHRLVIHPSFTVDYGRRKPIVSRMETEE